MNRGMFIIFGACIALVLFPLPAIVVPAVCCSVFLSGKGWSGRWTLIAITLLVLELGTGRMPGVLSLSFIAVAGGALLLERFVAWNGGGAARTIIISSVVTVAMTVFGVALAAFVYGRGYFAARLALALPQASWWQVPVACSLVIGIMHIPWRGGNNNLDTP